jgi:2'-5' RNA ligase
MAETSRENAPKRSHIQGFERFMGLRELTNHWARPTGSPSYYWYLTFEDSSNLQYHARRCQEAISFPYYDLIPPSDLHLTLDRVAFEGNVTSDQLRAIEAAAIHAFERVSPFDITISSLGGTSGAVGFNASPSESIKRLRDIFREATLSAYPTAPIKASEFHAHVTIAYCNSDGIPAAQAVAAVEQLNRLPRIDVRIEEGTLVLLERRQRAYAWQAISRIPFSG